MTVQRNGQQRQSYDGKKRLWIKDHGNVYKTKDQLYGILLSIFKNLMFIFLSLQRFFDSSSNKFNWYHEKYSSQLKNSKNINILIKHNSVKFIFVL